MIECIRKDPDTFKIYECEFMLVAGKLESVGTYLTDTRVSFDTKAAPKAEKTPICDVITISRRSDKTVTMRDLYHSFWFRSHSGGGCPCVPLWLRRAREWRQRWRGEQNQNEKAIWSQSLSEKPMLSIYKPTVRALSVCSIAECAGMFLVPEWMPYSAI
jgi:hypothetical protein